MFDIQISIIQNGSEIATSRSRTDKLDKITRNIIVRTLFHKFYGKYPVMEVYSIINLNLRKYGINLSERQIMRILRK